MTVAEITIKDVVSMWIKKADAEEVGCSTSKYRSRFQRGCMSFAIASAFSKDITCGSGSWRGEDALLCGSLWGVADRVKGIESDMKKDGRSPEH